MIVLDELHVTTNLLTKFSRVPTFEEKAPLILEHLGLENQHVGNRRRLYHLHALTQLASFNEFNDAVRERFDEC
jgi:hypothetical protein